MKIVFLNKTEKEWQFVLNQLKQEFPNETFLTSDDGTRTELIKNADAIVCGRISEDEINSSSSLKVIFVPFTGLNNFPLDLIKQENIILSNTHANAPYVAEHAVAMALALLGNINLFHNDLKQGKWNRDNKQGLWTSFRNKNVGILGLGHIGGNIAKILKPFDCKIYGLRKSSAAEIPQFVHEISTNLHYVVKQSEIIFVCLPLSTETRNIINAEILSEMKEKYLINIG